MKRFQFPFLVYVTTKGHRDRDRMVVGFITTCATSAYRNKSCGFDIALCDKVCYRSCFSLSTPIASTINNNCHDITEILLKVALNTIALKRQSCQIILVHWIVPLKSLGFYQSENQGYTWFNIGHHWGKSLQSTLLRIQLTDEIRIVAEWHFASFKRLCFMWTLFEDFWENPTIHIYWFIVPYLCISHDKTYFKIASTGLQSCLSTFTGYNRVMYRLPEFMSYLCLSVFVFAYSGMSITYCVVFLFCCSSSCVPNVASFPGLSLFDCPFGII